MIRKWLKDGTSRFSAIFPLYDHFPSFAGGCEKSDFLQNLCLFFVTHYSVVLVVVLFVAFFLSFSLFSVLSLFVLFFPF